MGGRMVVFQFCRAPPLRDEKEKAGLRLFGAFLAAVHLLLSWAIILSIRPNPDAQWGLIWIPLFVIDFPLSMIAAGLVYVLPDWYVDEWSYPYGSFGRFIAPAVFHGVIGPVWFYFLPRLWSNTAKVWGERWDRRRSRRQSGPKDS